MRFAVLTLSVFFYFPSLAQDFALVDLGESFGLYCETEYGNGVSAYDVNKDGWPDLTVCRHGQPVAVLLNNEGTFNGISFELGTPSQARHFNWVDIDNDGDADGCLTTAEGFVQVFEQTEPLVFEDVTVLSGMQNSTIERYSNSWGDVDGDGYLDCYIPVYDLGLEETGVTNSLYMSNGDFTFTNLAESSPTHDGLRSSFMGTFWDFDNDLDADLFVNNDRSIHPNSMYINDGGVYLEMTGEVGLEQYFYPMSNTVVDYNNDGYLDLFMSNNSDGNYLMANDEGTGFINESANSGIQVFEFGWAGNFFDYDNDTDMDFHYCTMPFVFDFGQDHFFSNNGDGTFVELTNQSGLPTYSTYSYASAIGDFDMNGTVDLVVYSEEPHGLQLWMNQSEVGNYVKFTLEGVECNADAVGTRVECYAGDTYQTKYTMCGEAYLGQNSDIVHFGLGEHEKADSVIFTFPNGSVNTLYNVPTGGLLHVVEDAPLSLNLEPSGSTTFCVGESVTFTAPGFGEDLQWSTGDSGSTLEVTEAGSYYAYWVSENDTLYSQYFTVQVVPNPTVNFNLIVPECPGPASYVNLVPGPSTTSISWENSNNSGWMTGQIAVGNYELMLENALGCSSDTTLVVPQVPALLDSLSVTHASCFNSADGQAIAHLGSYEGIEVAWGDLNPDALLPGAYVVAITTNIGCSQQAQVIVESPPEMIVSTTTVAPSCHDTSDGELHVSCEGGLPNYTYAFDTETPLACAAGTYNVWVTDSIGCQVSETIILDGPPPLSLEIAHLSEGELGHLTEALVDGGTPPYEVTWTSPSEGITGMTAWLNPEEAYAVSVTDDHLCQTEGTWTDITALEASTQHWAHPSLFNDHLILSGTAHAGTWVVFNLQGQRIAEGTLSNWDTAVNTSLWQQGIYMLHVQTATFGSIQHLSKLP